MELFDCESYRIDTVVKDSKKFVLKNNPMLPNETKEDYAERIFWLTNDEISRRILISGKKRPDYSNQNIRFKENKNIKIMNKNIKKLLTY